MNNELIITIIIMIVIAAAVVTLVLVIYYNNKKYRQFVKDNSVALAKLKELNDCYQFLKIKNFDMSHSYDNENFYSDISCQDYLTYELVYKQKEVSKPKPWNGCAKRIDFLRMVHSFPTLSHDRKTLF